ncbi:Beta-(1--_2)glucan export ATP-binding/permease protein NdvA [Rhodovastum atsumiense]|uniref:Glucan ABC transporter ATP-binding protein/ permease n=1 Tax=Rhodovastum atsumiense TaxID=504468 RepID=A0A5M6IJQ6_9PROT|nr:glucan ABC transporter ATP-binding protein/ permease [Rhodovastum atsumiense]KAA5608491.1 glucan ABC transporter ATP-binding protein/ permease [Rhodovastum atsumiense]CAH2599293.1 Beta-(1-->2)glucan export ATP-binding/permease protein NdvA [Rhodovastum atsumiense]
MHFLKIYGRVLGLLRADAGVAAVLALANLAIAGLQFLDPLLFGRVIDLLSRSATLPGEVLWHDSTRLLGTWAGLGLLAILTSILVALFADRLAHRRRLEVMSRLHAHVLALPLAFHGARHTGQILRVMLGGADTLFGLWLGFFREQLSAIVAALVLLPLTLAMNWRLGLVLLALVVAFCAMTSFVIRRTEGRQRLAERYHNELAGTVQDGLANVPVVQSFTQIGQERLRFGEAAARLVANQFPVLGWWAFVTVMGRAASTLAVLAIIVVGTLLHLRGQAGVGEIVTFMGLATLLIGRLESTMWFVAKLFSTVPMLDEFFGILDTPSSVPERPGAPALVVPAGEVRFEAVRFAYPGGPEILRGIDLVVHPGQCVALVGQTGAGKSTAMALLQRLWDPTDGRVLIDGQDIRGVTLDSLRRGIGVVFQDSMLFNRSIRENLLVGRPDATQAEIERACGLAEAHDFILRQPEGYDTMVGERGATLSGGQKQRLAIARALLKAPPILILDEATSALDAATEARVAQGLRALMAGRTTFVIAHRLSTVREADEILVFEGGGIVERGRFEDLVAAGGRFAALVATQLGVVPPAGLAEAAD